MNRFQNTFETEELASHGFIVAAIDHPYDSDLVVFPDGRRIYHSDKAEYLDYTSEAALRQSRSRVERRLAVRVADAQFVLDELTRWNTQDHGNRFFGHIDLHHIGIFGHSFGGAVAAELCRVDPRLGAGVNMDGTIFGTAKIQGIPKPYLVMFEGTQRPSKAKLESGDEMARRQAHDDNEDYDDVERTLSRYGGYFVQIPGISHMGFTDYPLHSQLGDWSGARILTVRRAHEMINRVTLAFFRRELLNDPSAAVEAVTRGYKGVILQSRQPGVQFSTNNANTSPSR